MNYLSATLIFIGYHVINIPLAYWNVEIVMNRIIKGNKKQIQHFWWGLGYVVICLPQYIIFNPWFFVAILIPHLTVFGPFYNHYRGFDPFTLSRTSTSLTERFMVKIGLRDMEGACLLSEVLAIVLFTISLFKL